MNKTMKYLSYECKFCHRKRGHEKDCIMQGMKDTEPKILIPKDMGSTTEPKWSYFLYFPIPNGVDEGLYLTQGEVVTLLRINKRNPAAIQYIADMME